MPRETLAPTLRSVLIIGAWPPRETGLADQAEAELRALLAVARAAERLDRAMDDRNGADTLWSVEDERESNKRAISRLRRVSAGRARGKGADR